MALTSDVERVEAARSALEKEESDKMASQALSAPVEGELIPEAEGYEPIPGITPGRTRQGPLSDPSLGDKTVEELIEGRNRLIEVMDNPPVEQREAQQMGSFQSLLIRINSELQRRGVQL